jgi:predicted transcriptional regulator
MSDPAEKIQISIRVPSGTVESFDKIAAALERDRSWVMLKAFNKYLREDGARILEEAEGIAELERGESVDFDEVIDKAKGIIAKAKEARARKTG